MSQKEWPDVLYDWEEDWPDEIDDSEFGPSPLKPLLPIFMDMKDAQQARDEYLQRRAYERANGPQYIDVELHIPLHWEITVGELICINDCHYRVLDILSVTYTVGESMKLVKLLIVEVSSPFDFLPEAE